MTTAEPDPATATNSAGLPPRGARQRWRVTYRRDVDAPRLRERDQQQAWESGLAGSGLPVVGLDLPRLRPRIVFAAQLGVGMAAERERFDLFLTARWGIADVRERLERALPAGHALIDLEDVWLGAPALAGQVVAADYRIELRVAVDRACLREAAARLLAAPTLPRAREKGGRTIHYDLRPLLERIEADGEPPELRVRTRFDPERGVGRPDEVLGALAEAAGLPLEPASIVRERLILAGER